MKLYYKKLGQGKSKIIILHGLYGASDNWFGIAKVLSQSFEVYLVDLRNHGRSPHSDIHSYKAMSGDVLELMDNNSISKAILLGHSMGGKVAMQLAINNPERIESLIIVDIAPKDYRQNKNIAQHKEILKSMLKIDLSILKKRDDLKDQLSAYLSNDFTYQFVAKNLKRDKQQGFAWKINIPVLLKEIGSIADGVTYDVINKDVIYPVLFVKGENSNYIQESDTKIIRDLFPNAQIQVIKDVEHWIHAQKPKELLELILKFLEV